ncbi:hypothetical protein SBFV3_gp53 [Sulfolobales Beppu filamentous virus 3]|uniref:Uncharacterized protein n=1 Tax=Sulfolobales Beppu filamentous virus 3 TaxID=2493124 RepID=A0A3S8NF63_9VIRU|nr:hypothetical protein HOU83_gp53 [Sulfolobales Beppu filamentous virus 3]AZI75888.1 hypothetical protein SBFV3_gp53 [Sulfolobales Beppu filamentous virus 3]
MGEEKRENKLEATPLDFLNTIFILLNKYNIEINVSVVSQRGQISNISIKFIESPISRIERDKHQFHIIFNDDDVLYLEDDANGFAYAIFYKQRMSEWKFIEGYNYGLDVNFEMRFVEIQLMKTKE